MTCGGSDDVVTACRSRNRAVHAAPGLHRGVGREAAFEDFIPADEPSVFAVKELLDSPDEVALQFMFVVKPLGFDAGF